MKKAITGFLIGCLMVTIPGCRNKQTKSVQNSCNRSVIKTDLSAFEARHADIYLPGVITIGVLDFEKKILVFEVPCSLDLLIEDYVQQMDFLGWHIVQKSCDGYGFVLFTKQSKTLSLHARSLSSDITEVSLVLFFSKKI